MRISCPECGDDMLYKVESGGTMLGWGFVPEGHKHDPNQHWTLYRCLHGHDIEIYWRDTCPIKDCEFNLGVA